MQREYVATQHAVTRAAGRAAGLARREAAKLAQQRTDVAQGLARVRAQTRAAREDLESSAEKVQHMALALEDRKGHAGKLLGRMEQELKERKRWLAEARKEESDATKLRNDARDKVRSRPGSCARLGRPFTALRRCSGRTRGWRSCGLSRNASSR